MENNDVSVVLEGMTSLSALLNSTDNNTRRIHRVLIDATKKKSKAREIAFLTAKSKELGFEISFVASDEIDAHADGSTHGGILALCTPRELLPLDIAQIKKEGFYVLLDGIEDPYNFGYILRSLYAAGVDGVLLPERNWMNAAGVVARASAGASELLPLFTCDTETVGAQFHSIGYRVLCAGIRDSVSLYEEDFPLPILLVVGGEKRGISRTLLEQADCIVRIDYGRAFRGSLSAACAASVMAFELLRQNREIFLHGSDL